MRTVRNHVLIAGGGNAALCAAIAAREQGANVTVLEHAGVQMRGGNTRHTRNLRAAHDAPVLTMTGSYSEQEFYDDLLNVTHGRTNENLARLMISKSLGQNITVGILDIPDRRHDAEGKESMIGTVYWSLGYGAPPKIPIRRIYSQQPIDLDVIDAIGNLFSANGFQVQKYQRVIECHDLSDERLCVKGQINHFWTEAFNRVGAIVDIDIEIWDRKHHKVIWNGKITNVEKKHGPIGPFALADTDKMVLFLNYVLSEAINTAWTIGGMREALEEWTIEEKGED